MAWETIEANPGELDEAIASFQSGVTSIDAFSVTSHGHNRVVALIRYSP
ncbi:hypothetical protein [Halobaculum sp. EA56]